MIIDVYFDAFHAFAISFDYEIFSLMISYLGDLFSFHSIFSFHFIEYFLTFSSITFIIDIDDTYWLLLWL